MSGFAPPSSNSASKASSSSPPSSLAAQPSGNSSAGNESSRRSASSSGGGGGAAAAARSNQASPRNNQGGKRTHKNHRKPNTPGLEDYADDHAAMASTGGNRRGTSITHLMNWSLPPPTHQSHPRSRNTSRRNPTWGLGSGYHAVDKARYVNANYRFIVDPRGDYRAQSIDSDVHLPWDMVLQVLASAQSQTANCPICLSVPVAPRMAKCGHIFCLPCLMRYMSIVDEGKAPPPDKKPRYKKCPICWDTIFMSDVRPVRWFTGQEGEILQDGVEVVLRLMVRSQGSTLVLPRDGADVATDSDGIPWHFAPEVADYARLMKGTRSYMQEQMKQEIQDLKVMGREDEVMFGEAGDWTRKAIASIKSQIESMDALDDVQPPPAVEAKEPEPPKPELKLNDNPESVPHMYHVMHAARSGQVLPVTFPHAQPAPGDAPEAPPQKPVSIPDERKIKPGEFSEASYYFYRALPHYYLPPLDIRILKAAFGPFHAFPPTIVPRVENISSGHIVDDEFRRKTKYLAHLPYGTEVAFLECDWSGAIPAEVLDKFKADIERRRKRKRDKEIQEERDRLRAEKEGDDSMWAFERQHRKDAAAARGNLFLEDDFVALAIDQSQHESAAALAAAAASEVGLTPLSSPQGGVGSASTPLSPPLHPQSSSLAQQSEPASPNRYRTVWGTTAIASSSDAASSTSNRNDDGWADWERDYLLEEDLMAHEHYDDNLARTPGHNPMGVGKGGSKKSKKKKVTLMTNGGKRGA
ncbi:hypothetical protein DFH27DRAFT_558485 [Peziza echinospora]|nr:hypothetical protein DFH27DRAFT_558485 [Peziza echinospora]